MVFGSRPGDGTGINAVSEEYHYSHGNEKETRPPNEEMSRGWKAALCAVALGMVVGVIYMIATACISLMDNSPSSIALVCPGSSLWACLLIAVASVVILGLGGSVFRCVAMLCGMSDQRANAIWVNTSAISTMGLYVWMSVESWGEACTNMHLTGSPVYKSLLLYWQVTTAFLGMCAAVLCCACCLKKS